MNIAMLGIGLMGKPMTQNLARAGHALDLWNRTPEKAHKLDAIAHVHETPHAAVESAECVICMLSDGPVTTQLLQEQAVLEACRPGCLIINMGSVEPDRDIQHAKAANDLGLRYLDAPVSGGVKGAEEATLSIFVGGAQQDFADAQPVLQALGNPHHIGPSGTGQSAKLANQLIVGITIGAVSEAFLLAEKAGCDLAVLQKALQGGFADSRILNLHGERMVKGNYQPGARSRTQLKDIHNAQKVAADAKLVLPLANTVEQAYQSLIEDYDGGDLDHAAYFYGLQKQHE